MRLKEVKISIHRKYTKNFNSYGYRIGIMLDVDKSDNARTCYYSGKAFLNDRIAEEDLIIRNLMDKKDAEKESGYKELEVIPAKLIDLGGLKGFESEAGRIHKIVEVTGLSRDDVVNLAKEKMNELRGLISEEGAVYIVGRELGVSVVEGKEGGGNIMIPYDIRQIKQVTGKAVLVELYGGKGDLWIPKSCVKDGDAVGLFDKGVKTMLLVKNWFLEKSGLL